MANIYVRDTSWNSSFDYGKLVGNVLIDPVPLWCDPISSADNDYGPTGLCSCDQTQLQGNLA